MRRTLKVGLIGVAKSACPVTTVAWRLGEDFEPLLAVTYRQLDTWARLWRTWPRPERVQVTAGMGSGQRSPPHGIGVAVTPILD